eukprot:3901-Heterococcus_DN1.PRE.1
MVGRGSEFLKLHNKEALQVRRSASVYSVLQRTVCSIIGFKFGCALADHESSSGAVVFVMRQTAELQNVSKLNQATILVLAAFDAAQADAAVSVACLLEFFDTVVIVTHSMQSSIKTSLHRCSLLPPVHCVN